MSQFAYVHYNQTIQSGDVTAKGELVQLNSPCLEGNTDLVSVAEFQRLLADFPQCVKGGVIEDDNLMNMINYCYDELKKSAEGFADKVTNDEKFDRYYYIMQAIGRNHDEFSHVFNDAYKVYEDGLKDQLYIQAMENIIEYALGNRGDFPYIYEG